MTKKTKKLLTVNDIVAPGDMLDVLRRGLDELPTTNGMVLIKRTRDGSIDVEFAGCDWLEALGMMAMANTLLTEDNRKCDD